MKKSFILICFLVLVFTTSCSGNVTTDNVSSTQISENATFKNEQSTIQGNPKIETPSVEPTEAIFDVTQAYANKPYTDEFVLQRVDDLQYINLPSMYNLHSDKETPIFYDGFFHEKGKFNVTLDKYNYEMDNETIRKYFDTYEYSKYASVGALRVIDSFVYNDIDNNRSIYYCYYTVTHWGEGEDLDTLDYYRDVFNVDHKTKEISEPEKVEIVIGLKIPKEITGYHDFHGVI